LNSRADFQSRLFFEYCNGVLAKGSVVTSPMMDDDRCPELDQA